MESIVTLVIIVISVIGWISNAVNEKKKPQNVGGNQPPRKKRKLQNELESFLQELQGENPQPPQKQRPEKKKQTHRQQKPQKKTRSRSEKKQKSSSQKRRSSQPHSSSSPSKSKHESVFKDDASRQVGSGNIGKNLDKHVESYISSRRSGTLESSQVTLESSQVTFDQSSFSDHVTKNQKQGKNVAVARSATQDALDLLHSSDSIRTAMVLNEILQPPVSQRPSRF